MVSGAKGLLKIISCFQLYFISAIGAESISAKNWFSPAIPQINP